MEKEKALDSIHTNVHGLRLIQGYKPSAFEINTAKNITEMYKATCDECKAVSERPQVENKNFLNKLGDLFK